MAKKALSYLNWRQQQGMEYSGEEEDEAEGITGELNSIASPTVRPRHPPPHPHRRSQPSTSTGHADTASPARTDDGKGSYRGGGY